MQSPMPDCRPYVIRQGDHLAKLAYLHGFEAMAVWQHDKNAELRQRRDPGVLNPGDVLYIPTSGQPGLAVQRGDAHRYQAAIPMLEMQLVFTDDRAPLADEPCEVLGCVGSPLETKLDANGVLKLQISVLTSSVEVYFPRAQIRHVLGVGAMDPADTVMGELKRLQNLGYLDDEMLAHYPRAQLLALARDRFTTQQSAADDYHEQLKKMAGV